MPVISINFHKLFNEINKTKKSLEGTKVIWIVTFRVIYVKLFLNI